MTLLGILTFIAVALTYTMFTTRQAMLGLAAAMFWAMSGAQAYTLSVGAWVDLYYYMFFASTFGMTIFCAFAAFGLRAGKDTGTDEDVYIDEKGEDKAKYLDDGASEGKFYDEKSKPSQRTTELRKRAEARRTGGKREGDNW